MRLKALELAASVWDENLYLSKSERLDAVGDLYSFQLFSQNQLAKIARLSVTQIGRHFPDAGVRGGRFAPEALPFLVYIRKAVLSEERVSKRHVQVAADAGCSVSWIAHITDAAYSTLYWMERDR
jgi:hypothetical protein